MVAEAWDGEWDEAEDKVADGAAAVWARGAGAVWVLRATALDLPAGRSQEPRQMVGEHPAAAC